MRFFSSDIPRPSEKYQETLGSNGAETYRNLAIIGIFVLFEYEVLSKVFLTKYSCCMGRGPIIEPIPHPGRPFSGLCGQNTLNVFVIQKITSTDKSWWLCESRVT